MVLCTILSIACLAVGCTAMGASARMEARWALQTGDILTGEDISIEHPTSVLFHQQAMSASDLESLQLSFPGTLDFNVAGSPGDGVGLALPSISETADRTISQSSTGYFKANWAYMADMAAANAGSSPLGASFGNIQPFKSGRMIGSGLLWPYMTPLPAASSFSPKLSIQSMSIDNDLFNASRIMRSIANSTAANASSGTAASNASQEVRKPPVNPASTAAQIKDMPDMERLLRNAFIGSTMYKAYEGPTQYPEWIDPYDNGRGVFDQINMSHILSLAHSETLPCTHIAPVFWDL